MDQEKRKAFCQIISPLLSTLDMTCLVRIAQSFPLTWEIPLIHFEFPLHTKRSTPDFLFYIDLLQGLSLPWNFPQSKPWQILSSILLQECQTRFLSNHNILGVWLEFDRQMKQQYPLDPNFLFVTKGMSFETIKLVMSRILSLHPGSPSHLGEIFDDKALHQCVQQGWEIGFLGFMLARSVPPIRMGINYAQNKTADFLAALQILSYKYDGLFLDSFLKKMAFFPGPILLSLDFEKTVKPRIGLECKPVGIEISEQHRFWSSFFRFLETENLMSKEQSRWFLNWLKEQVHPLQKKGTFGIREINHVKFVFIPHDPIRVKLYLGIRQATASGDRSLPRENVLV